MIYKVNQTLEVGKRLDRAITGVQDNQCWINTVFLNPLTCYLSLLFSSIFKSGAKVQTEKYTQQLVIIIYNYSELFIRRQSGSQNYGCSKVYRHVALCVKKQRCCTLSQLATVRKQRQTDGQTDRPTTDGDTTRLLLKMSAIHSGYVEITWWAEQEMTLAAPDSHLIGGCHKVIDRVRGECECSGQTLVSKHKKIWFRVLFFVFFAFQTYCVSQRPLGVLTLPTSLSPSARASAEVRSVAQWLRPGGASVWLKHLGQILQKGQQLLLLQGRAVGPGQRQVGGHNLPVCRQKQRRRRKEQVHPLAGGERSISSVLRLHGVGRGPSWSDLKLCLAGDETAKGVQTTASSIC